MPDDKKLQELKKRVKQFMADGTIKLLF